MGLKQRSPARKRFCERHWARVTAALPQDVVLNLQQSFPGPWTGSFVLAEGD